MAARKTLDLKTVDNLLKAMNAGKWFSIEDFIELQCLQRSGEVLMSLAQIFQKVAA